MLNTWLMCGPCSACMYIETDFYFLFFGYDIFFIVYTSDKEKSPQYLVRGLCSLGMFVLDLSVQVGITERIGSGSDLCAWWKMLSNKWLYEQLDLGLI